MNMNNSHTFFEYTVVAIPDITPFSSIILFVLLPVGDVTSLISELATNRACLLVGQKVAGTKAISITSFQGLVVGK